MKGGVNRYDRPCPDWCTADHQDPDAAWMCVSEQAMVSRDGLRRAASSASWHVFEDRPQVAAMLWGKSLLFGVAYATSDYEAENLASFVECAAEASKGDLRQLAARIRESAAIAFPETEAEAS